MLPENKQGVEDSSPPSPDLVGIDLNLLYRVDQIVAAWRLTREEETALRSIASGCQVAIHTRDTVIMRASDWNVMIRKALSGMAK